MCRKKAAFVCWGERGGVAASIITIKREGEKGGKPHSHKKGSGCGFVSSRVIPAAEEPIETSAAEMECSSLTGDL